MTELATLTASEMLAGYGARRFSPVDVAEAVIARIGRLDPRLNSVVHLDVDAARDGARAAERAFRSGAEVGPLCGVPVGIKDMIDVAGMPTTCHSKILLDHRAGRDAEVVRRLRAAGANIFCKLATHEFALGGPSFDLPFPPARNPWNLDYNPGGSSSGSGAAVAGGLMPIAVGTDTAGSIRHPAGACGVFGLKPTYETLSRAGVFPLAFSLDHVGPLARNAADTLLAFDVMAGRDPRTGGRHSLTGIRIGYVRHFHTENVSADPDVAAALDRAAQRLAEAGAEVVEARLPPLQDFLVANRMILFAESFAIHAEWLRQRPEDYGALGRQRLMVGAFLTAEDYIQAQRQRTALTRAVEEVLVRHDLLLTANMFDPPCRIDDPEALVLTGRRQARAPFNVTGHPAASFTTGVSVAGLPLSGQLVGRRDGEDLVMRAAGAFDDVTRPAPI